MVEFDGDYYIRDAKKYHCCDIPTHIYMELDEYGQKYIDEVMKRCKFSPEAEEFNKNCRRRN